MNPNNQTVILGNIHHTAINESLRYLESDEAIKSIEENVYWPKWNAPWWHVTTLHEMGLAHKIPKRAIRKMLDRLKASPVTIFPIHPHDLPPGTDVFVETHCHCALGNIYQALAAAGADVDGELPWIRKWFLRYQLPDGGLNCDSNAYLKDPPPSSIVGTIAPLEAVLLHTNRPFTKEEETFLDKGARCLLNRELRHATTNPHNAEEKEDEVDWLRPCFPRFYFYDVLRGLIFVLKWADKRNLPIHWTSIEPVIKHLQGQFPDSKIHNQRQSYEGVLTRVRNETGQWQRRQHASLFPLLKQVSGVSETSPFLTQQWHEAQQLIKTLTHRGHLLESANAVPS